MFFWRVLEGAFGKIPRIRCVQLAGRGVPGKGRIGVKPLSKGMWFVGLKKDGCRIEKGLWPVNWAGGFFIRVWGVGPLDHFG